MPPQPSQAEGALFQGQEETQEGLKLPLAQGPASVHVTLRSYHGWPWRGQGGTSSELAGLKSAWTAMQMALRQEHCTRAPSRPARPMSPLALQEEGRRWTGVSFPETGSWGVEEKQGLELSAEVAGASQGAVLQKV